MSAIPIETRVALGLLADQLETTIKLVRALVPPCGYCRGTGVVRIDEPCIACGGTGVEELDQADAVDDDPDVDRRIDALRDRRHEDIA